MPETLDLDRVRGGLTGAAAAWRLESHGEVGSTMDIARDHALAGHAGGLVVVAESQTAGRGRLGRTWVSAPGVNLYFTVILRPSMALLRRLAMVAPLAVAEGIQAVSGLSAEIKWPNDVQLNGLKCGGILIDSEVRGASPVFAIAGIGLNVNLDVLATPELAGIATSLAAALGRDVSREDVLAATLSKFAGLCECVDRGEAVQARWKARLNTLGRRVQVTGSHSIDAGVVEDADEEGSLCLRRDDGSLVRVAAGEVTLRA